MNTFFNWLEHMLSEYYGLRKQRQTPQPWILTLSRSFHWHEGIGWTALGCFIYWLSVQRFKQVLVQFHKEPQSFEITRIKLTTLFYSIAVVGSTEDCEALQISSKLIFASQVLMRSLTPKVKLRWLLNLFSILHWPPSTNNLIELIGILIFVLQFSNQERMILFPWAVFTLQAIKLKSTKHGHFKSIRTALEDVVHKHSLRHFWVLASNL